jgi:hypothetical protein
MTIYEQAGWQKYDEALEGTTVGVSYTKKPLHLWVSEGKSIKVTAALPCGLILMAHVATPSTPADLQLLEGRMLTAKMGAEMMLGGAA